LRPSRFKETTRSDPQRWLAVAPQPRNARQPLGDICVCSQSFITPICNPSEIGMRRSFQLTSQRTVIVIRRIWRSQLFRNAPAIIDLQSLPYGVVEVGLNGCSRSCGIFACVTFNHCRVSALHRHSIVSASGPDNHSGHEARYDCGWRSHHRFINDPRGATEKGLRD
jgi:hypothetical protein